MNPNNYQTYLNNNGGANPIPAQGSQPNGLEKLLPTIGGIAGGVLGDILPGGPITGVAGAAGGDALGKFLEDKLTGQAGGNGVLSSAIEGGLGQGVGGILAKGGQALLGGAGDVLGSAATNREGAVADEALNKGLTGLSNKDLVQGGVGQGKSLIKSMGVTPTPENMANIPQAVGDAFNTHIDNVLKTTGPVDTTEVGRQIAKLDPVTQNLLTPKLGDATSVFSENTDAGDARKLLGAVQEAQADAKPVVQSVGGKIDPVAKQQYQNLGKVVDTLKSAIYSRPGVDEAFAAAKGSATPEQMLASAPDLSPEEAVAASKYANATMDSAKNGQDILTPYSKSISLGQAGKKAVAFNNDVLPIRPTATENPELIGKGTQSVLGAAHPALAAGAKALNVVQDKIPLAGVSKVLGKAAASKVLPAIAKSGAIAATNIPNDAASAATPGASAIPATTPQSNMGGTMAPTLDPTQQYYQTLLAQLQAQPADAQTGSILGALNGVVPVAQKQSLAAPILSSLLGSYQNAGGAQGPVAGGLSQASSVIPGSAAATYQGQESTAADTLASLLGITPQAAMQLLPGLMQTQATAASPQAALQRILGSVGGAPSAVPTATAF